MNEIKNDGEFIRDEAIEEKEVLSSEAVDAAEKRPAEPREKKDTQRSGECCGRECFESQAISESEAENPDENCETQQIGICSHAEGSETAACAASSHTEGCGTTASGYYSHAKGFFTTASGIASHAEGYHATASAYYAHAEGSSTASGDISHGEGMRTDTNGKMGAHIMGRFGDACESFSWHMANGTDSDNRSLSAAILNNGTAYFSSVRIENLFGSFAQMFETDDGKSVDAGYFVTFFGQSDKIRKVTSQDDYVLGVTCAAPAILAGSNDLNWGFKCVTDEWGRALYHEVTVQEMTDQDGNVLFPERIELQPVQNPVYQDKNQYIPRSKRSEWAAVCLLGMVLVRDDGTCQAGGSCRPGGGGIATASRFGYRVIRRTGAYQVLILYR